MSRLNGWNSFHFHLAKKIVAKVLPLMLRAVLFRLYVTAVIFVMTL